MSVDTRLAKLREMDSTIGTFTALDIIQNPEIVYQRYMEHAETHMSLGDASDYLNRLLHWTKDNQGCVVGGISGDFGYGKTSTAIHLWKECEKSGIIAVPPFAWYKLHDIIDATWAWVRFKINKIKPGLVASIDNIHEKFLELSLQDYATRWDIPIEIAFQQYTQKQINLTSSPEKVVTFLFEINAILSNNDLGLYGPIVFTDELQVTMTNYLENHRSRDEFMQDIFELLRTLLNNNGSYGVMMCMPLNTETLINSTRPDILQRLQERKLFIRPNMMYKRTFPYELWKKFAEIYNFEDISELIIPDETLDSIGQIAFRSDLGAGPRTVIQSFRYAIDIFDSTNQPFSPISLIDAYLSGLVSFDSGGKLVNAVNEVLQSTKVTQLDKGKETIKLVAAFPYGCPEALLEKYGLNETFEKLSRKIYAEYFYKFPEGISLRKLAPTDKGAEPRFIELTKEFIQTYSESDRDIQLATKVFGEVIVEERLLKGAERRADQVDGWTKSISKYVGTFDKRYPERNLNIFITTELPQNNLKVEEFGFVFWLNLNCDKNPQKRIKFSTNAGYITQLSLDLLCKPVSTLNIPYIYELGYPPQKVTPAFMLALLGHLRKNSDSIPEDEKRAPLLTFTRILIDYSVELIFGNDLLNNSEIEGLTKVGLSLIEEVFSKMCRLKYPKYETLMTTGRWNSIYNSYFSALENGKILPSIGAIRGSKFVNFSQNDLLALFNQTNIQGMKGYCINVSNILEVNLSSKADSPSSVRFKLHPAEEAFMSELRASEDKIKSSHGYLKALDRLKGWEFLSNLGYRQDEILLILRLLKTRRLITYDEKRNLFVEILESPIEKREAILALLTEIDSRIEILSHIPDFDIDTYRTKSISYRNQITPCVDIEKLEEYQNQVTEFSETVNKFVSTWGNKLQNELLKLKGEIEQITKVGIPEELGKSLKGDVNWVGELVQCQALIKEKYQRGFNQTRQVERTISTELRNWEEISSGSGKYQGLNNLFDQNKVAAASMYEAKIEIEGAKNYYQSLLNWSNLLLTASKAHLEAVNCETTYSEDGFRKELDKIFSEISSDLNKKRLEALANHEIYSENIKEVQKKIDNWLREQRDAFMKAKIFYEDTLSEIGVAQKTLRASFDAFDPLTSFNNLYEEILDKTRERIDALDKERIRFGNEILFAEKVAQADVTIPTELYTNAKSKFEYIRINVNDDCVRDQNCFSRLKINLCDWISSIREIEACLRGVLQKKEPTPEEDLILRLLDEHRGSDLSEIIVKRISIEGEDFELKRLLDLVISLFTKNQAIIKLERRR